MKDTPHIHNGPVKRRQWTAEAKLKVLHEGRSGAASLSQVCAQHDIRPSQFYQWEAVAERGALAALQGQKRGRKKQTPTEEALVAEVGRLREVIAELSLENLALKKGVWR
jgi:transposase-like protein